MHQHAAFSSRRYGAECQQRASRPAAGRRTDGLYSMDAATQASPSQPALAGPRSLRAVARTRLGVAVQPVVCDRLRVVAGGSQAVSAVGQQGPGPPRARPYAGRRGDHRTARPGSGECGWHGHWRSASRRALQPRWPSADRSPHLGDRQRRRPDGGHCRRGGLAGRPPATGQVDLSLRRQSRDAVGRHRNHVLRGLHTALRCLWLADPAYCRR